MPVESQGIGEDTSNADLSEHCVQPTFHGCTLFERPLEVAQSEQVGRRLQATAQAPDELQEARDFVGEIRFPLKASACTRSHVLSASFSFFGSAKTRTAEAWSFNMISARDSHWANA